jgi:hypothetical protein
MEREIIKNDIDIFLFTPPSQYTLTLLRKWLATSKNSPPLYHPHATLLIPDSFKQSVIKTREPEDFDVRLAPNWKSISATTVGRFIANNLIFSRSLELRSVFPYYDLPWDKKVIETIEKRLANVFLNKEITDEDITFAIDRMQWLGFAPTSFLVPSMTIDTIRAPKSTKKLKADILKSPTGDLIRNGNLKELGNFEKILLEDAKKNLDGVDPGFDIFKSGARGSFNNNFKNTSLLRGAIRKSDDPSQIKISTASLDEGIPINELPIYADLIVQATYGRSMMTAQGGYIAKQLNAAFQSLHLNPDPNSDCKTKLTLTVTIDNPNEYLFRFYVKNGKLVEILPDEADELKDKTVQMRSPLYCGDVDGICSKCAGTLHHRIGITNIGLIAGRIGTTLLNASLKQFHDSSLKQVKIDLSKFTKPL